MLEIAQYERVGLLTIGDCFRRFFNIHLLPSRKTFDLECTYLATSHIELACFSLAQPRILHSNYCPHLVIFDVLVQPPFGYPSLILPLCRGETRNPAYLVDDLRQRLVLSNVELLD